MMKKKSLKNDKNPLKKKSLFPTQNKITKKYPILLLACRVKPSFASHCWDK